MIRRMIAGALLRQRRRMLLIALTVALGASLATAMLNVLLDAGDKVSRELKSYGANITVTPRAASLARDLWGLPDAGVARGPFLAASEVTRIKTIFWANNIVDFAPFLETRVTLVADGAEATETGLVGTWFRRSLLLPTGETIETGARLLKTWWDVEGAWPADSDPEGVLVGRLLARQLRLRPGDRIAVRAQSARRPTDPTAAGEAIFVVRGILTGGGPEDRQILAPLERVQALEGVPDAVGRIEVSAITTPENDLARRAARDPDALSLREWETWYCTAYVSSIAYQIEEAIPGSRAKPLRQIAESEGLILSRTQVLMGLITVLSLIATSLGISNLVTAGVLERGREIGLLKALGASDRGVSLLVLAEAAVMGLGGGAVGYAAGIALARLIGRGVFRTAVEINGMVVPAIALLVLLVTIAGSLPALRLVLRLRPSQVLHGR